MHEHEESGAGHDWKAPAPKKETLQMIVPERSHREKMNSEIAAAVMKMKETALTDAELLSKVDISARLKLITSSLVEATDNQERHRLAVERAALIAYRKDLDRQEMTRLPREVADALDLPEVSPVEGEEPSLTQVEDWGASESEIRAEALEAPSPRAMLKEKVSKKRLEHDDVILIKDPTIIERVNHLPKSDAGRTPSPTAADETFPGIPAGNRKKAA